MSGNVHVPGALALPPLLTPSHFPCALQRIEEQRLAALLQEQQDAPVDVQVRAPTCPVPGGRMAASR